MSIFFFKTNLSLLWKIVVLKIKMKTCSVLNKIKCLTMNVVFATRGEQQKSSLFVS